MVSSKSLTVLMLCTYLACSLTAFPYNTIEHTEVKEIMSHNQKLVHMQIAGGWNAVPVNQANLQIDNYIKDQIPQLNNAKLVDVQSQVVNGINYSYTYELLDKLFTIQVWDHPSDRTRQIRGISKVVKSQNAQGQTIKTTTTAKLSGSKFVEAASKLFN